MTILAFSSIGARETAVGVLEGYKQTLEASKVAVRGALQVTEYITNFGLGGLVAVRAASFAGGLSNVSGGRVAMSIRLQFMDGAPHTLGLTFNFNNPVEAVETLARQLLPG